MALADAFALQHRAGSLMTGTSTTRRLILSLPLCGVGAFARAGQSNQPPRRVVSLGGTVTEIVYALGAGDWLVGVDSSSLYPAAARKLPQVGYYRGFAVEGVVSLRPDLVLASDQAGPPSALAQLRRVGIRLETVPSQPKVDALAEAITTVAQALGGEARGEELNRGIRKALSDVARSPALSPLGTLVLSSHTGRLQAAGRATAAHAMLELAGARNVFGDQEGYKAVSAEAVAGLAPEMIVTTSLSTPDGLAAFIAQPGIAATPAARAGRVLVMDDLLLLGFGPRLPEALQQLGAGLARTAPVQAAK
jgi:iron complex transport system substrate-binding protein